MRYASTVDYITAYGEKELLDLTDRVTPKTGVIDAAIADRALTDASAEADSYLMRVYALPLDSAPVVLTRHVLAIGRFLLFQKQAPDEVRERYDDALKWLKDVAAGRAALPYAEKAKEGNTGVVRVRRYVPEWEGRR